MDSLQRLGYIEGPPCVWCHRHYLDEWPVVRAVGDRWSCGGRIYASALDAIAMALEPDDHRQGLIHAARGCCDAT